VIPFVSENPVVSLSRDHSLYSEIVSRPGQEYFEQLPFDHPVYIMYSSGTTGLPKCMVQGPGVLLNHLKELTLHTDLRREDVIFYFTTCGWMMWNWLVSSLAVGATLVLFDGNPFHPTPGVLFDLAQKEGITVFGTSAKYLSALEAAGVVPQKEFDLSRLRTILSTGSPLSRESYRYVYDQIKADVQLSSISGGTDLNGCFALGNPVLPVYEGELQSRGLGMAVEVWDDSGKSVKEQKGELVCIRAFPSMPLFFWNDPDGSRYHKAYFDHFPGIWRHGDFAMITEHNGMIIYGRSDATLNPGGVRIGTADLYRIVESFGEIEDSVVVGQEWQNDQRVILFVKMKQGSLTEDLKKQISQKIRDSVSPRHVPAYIFQVPDIPYTRNLKKVELAVKRVIQDEPVTNRDALVNPECLEFYKNIPELRSQS
jgi:acetoacetyl-CoA synthetase